MLTIDYCHEVMINSPTARASRQLGAWTRHRNGTNSTPRKMPETAQNPQRPVHVEDCRNSDVRSGAVLGAFCLSQFTHKLTLPRNSDQIKNTTKPNSFLARETIRGYTFDTKIHAPFRPPRLEPEWKGRFQVFFGGKFSYQFYFVMKIENIITTPPAKWLLYGTSAPRCHPPFGPGRDGLPWLQKRQAS